MTYNPDNTPFLNFIHKEFDMAAAGTRGTVSQHVHYTHEQIQEILRDKAKEDLKEVNGKDPVGSSVVKFTGSEKGDTFIIAADIDFTSPGRK